VGRLEPAKKGRPCSTRRVKPMLEGSGCKEGRMELTDNVLSPKPTNNHLSLAYLFILVHSSSIFPEAF
jgi:hypothetical protein